ncbi:hypothetical protein D3C76_557480 [compost metagenome]
MADSQWIAPFITALSTISASTIAFYSAYKINSKNLKNEILKFEKQIQWEQEKLEMNIIREERLNKLKIYNKVLKLDGEVTVLSSYPIEFNIKSYEDNIRPILFEEYHIIDQDIKDITKKIDRIIKTCNMIEEIQGEHNEELVNNYVKLLNKIDNHYRRKEDKL